MPVTEIFCLKCDKVFQWLNVNVINYEKQLLILHLITLVFSCLCYYNCTEGQNLENREGFCIGQ